MVLIKPVEGRVLVISLSYKSFIHLLKSVTQFDSSFKFDALTVWNALPDVIHASSSIASFTKKLKSYLH